MKMLHVQTTLSREIKMIRREKKQRMEMREPWTQNMEDVRNGSSKISSCTRPRAPRKTGAGDNGKTGVVRRDSDSRKQKHKNNNNNNGL